MGRVTFLWIKLYSVTPEADGWLGKRPASVKSTPLAETSMEK